MARLHVKDENDYHEFLVPRVSLQDVIRYINLRNFGQDPIVDGNCVICVPKLVFVPSYSWSTSHMEDGSRYDITFRFTSFNMHEYEDPNEPLYLSGIAVLSSCAPPTRKWTNSFVHLSFGRSMTNSKLVT
jgi:hypothetical protein